MMEGTNLGAIHLAPSFPGVQNQKSVAAFFIDIFLLHILVPESHPGPRRWMKAAFKFTSNSAPGKLGVWKGGQALSVVSVGSVAFRRSWESRPKTSLTLTRRMSIAARPRCHLDPFGSFQGSGASANKNLSGSCCGRRPCCGDASRGWMFAPWFLSSFANLPIPSTSQAQVPQRSFVCQFST